MPDQRDTESEDDMFGSKAGVARRSFLMRLGAGTTLFGTAVAGAASPTAQSGGSAEWRSARHPQDDWLDLPGTHRFIFDTTTTQGLRNAVLYANNFFVGNQTGYGLKDADIAVVLVMRHNATAFAYNDAMWAKHGQALSKIVELSDPKTKEPYTVNALLSGGGGMTLDGLTKRGAHFAVCQMATRRFAGALAQAAGSTADVVYAELASNLIANSHLVPAGIVALGRAQERGYALAVST